MTGSFPTVSRTYTMNSRTAFRTSVHVRTAAKKEKDLSQSRGLAKKITWAVVATRSTGENPF